MTHPKAGLRYELKYLLRRSQLSGLIAELGQWLHPDGNGDERGVYPITSLYYDTPDYKAYWDKIDGQRSRRKVRVRIYGDATVKGVTPESTAFLEVKQRVNKLMHKRRVALSYGVAVDFDGLPDYAAQLDAGDDAGDMALLNEVYYLYRTLQLRPAAVVTYDRMAFEGDAQLPDLRVTIDTNLRGRVHDLSLASNGTTTDRTVLGAEHAILELKTNTTVPGWLAQLVHRHRCTFYRISKYCLVLEHSKAIAGRQHIITAGEMG